MKINPYKLQNIMVIAAITSGAGIIATGIHNSIRGDLKTDTFTKSIQVKELNPDAKKFLNLNKSALKQAYDATGSFIFDTAKIPRRF